MRSRTSRTWPAATTAYAVLFFAIQAGFCNWWLRRFRFGPVAYSTDVVELDERAFNTLEGIEVWIVDCLREERHPTHAHFDRTMEWVARVRPRRAVLTHMNHTLDYDALAARCPPGVEPGYDGLVIEVGAD